MRVGDDIPIFDLKDVLFHSKTPELYHYYGSFPYPGCDEIIIWLVNTKPLRINYRQYYNIDQALVVGRFPDGNARETQPLNNRVVYKVKVQDTDSDRWK